MKVFWFGIFFCFFCSFSSFAQYEETPEELVQRQLDAYNDRLIDQFLATYSDSIKIYNHPGDLIMDGKDDMSRIYGPMFEITPDLNCEIINRIVQGNTVIDQEHVTGFQNGFEINAVAIYEIKDGLIHRVYFVRNKLD